MLRPEEEIKPDPCDIHHMSGMSWCNTCGEQWDYGDRDMPCMEVPVLEFTGPAFERIDIPLFVVFACLAIFVSPYLGIGSWLAWCLWFALRRGR